MIHTGLAGAIISYNEAVAEAATAAKTDAKVAQLPGRYMKKYELYILMLICLTNPAWSQDNSTQPLEAVPPPPEIPEPLQSGEAIEPEVTIIQKEDSTVEEYRLNGNLYMVKITPSTGTPYYMIDKDGDGMMEFRTSKLGDDVVTPQWVLFAW